MVYTDHASLRTATQSPHLSQRMARWLSFFSEYNFSVEYKPGKQNILADALSRRPDYEVPKAPDPSSNAVSVTAESSIYARIKDAYKHDENCINYISYFTGVDIKCLNDKQKSRLQRFVYRDGLLYFAIDANEPARIVVPHDEDIKTDLLRVHHDSPMSGHPGVERTYLLLSNDFWWPNMLKWVKNYVKTCETCQRIKSSRSNQAPLRSLPIPNECWRSMSMDFIFGLPKDVQGNTGILVFVDRLSKMASKIQHHEQKTSSFVS